MPHDFISAAQRALGEGQGNLFDVLPSIIKRIIKDELWKGRNKGPKDDGAPFKSFREFAEYPLWFGLECTWNRLVLYCEHDDECRALLLGEVGELTKHGEVGKGRNRVDNINSKATGGTDPTYALARLKRDAPDLAKMVIDGELSANAAAIQAGFRKPTKTIPIDTPDAAVRALLRVFSCDELVMAFKNTAGGTDAAKDPQLGQVAVVPQGSRSASVDQAAPRSAEEPGMGGSQ